MIYHGNHSMDQYGREHDRQWREREISHSPDKPINDQTRDNQLRETFVNKFKVQTINYH